jgi:hypothetical protein
VRRGINKVNGTAWPFLHISNLAKLFISMGLFVICWSMGVGVIAVLRPGFFYNSNKLAPDRIERNKRIWRTAGVFLIVLGALGLIIELSNK